jgi:hypothetical protein
MSTMTAFKSLLSTARPDSLDYVPKICLYGDAFTGKTLMAGRLALLGYDVFYVDLDNATATLRNDELLTDEAKSRLFVLPVADLAAVGELTWTFFDPKKQKGICEEHGRYLCTGCTVNKKPMATIDLEPLDPKRTIVVLDSGGSLTDASIDKVRGTRPPDYLFQQPDWGMLRNILAIFLRQLKFHKLPTVFLTSVDYSKAEGSLMQKGYPAFGSSTLSPEVPKYFTETIYASTDASGKYSYVCLPAQAPKFAVGCRRPVDLKDKSVDQNNILSAFFKPIAPLALQ